MSNGDYVVASSEWDNGDVMDAGAVTFGIGSSGVTGSVTRSNSVIGTPPGLVDRPGARLTSGGAIPVPTSQNRVLLMFTNPSPDVITSNPARILDTRAGGETVDGEGQAAGVVGAGEFVEVPVVGRGGVPGSGVDAAIINVTVINPDGRGFATSYPCGTRPLASSLNYVAGQVVANELVAKLSPAGTICIFTSDTAHLVIDTVGHIPATSTVESLDPARILDTRVDGETVDGEGQAAGVVGAGEFVEVPVVGRGGVPGSGVDAAIINVTVINPDGRGFATSYPCGTRPLASSLNYEAGQMVANELVAKLSPAGTICIFTSDTAHLVIDAVGYAPTI